MRGIDHQFQAAQIQMAGEGGFAEFDIAVVRSVDAAGASEAGGRLGFHFLVDFGFDFQLDFITQFHAAFGKEFDAVVGIDVVRRGNHHAGGQTQRTGQISHTRRRQRAGLDDVDTCGGKTRHQRGFKHVAGNTRVFADKDSRLLPAVMLHQHLPRRITELQYEIGGNRELTDFAAHAVRAKIFFCHKFAP